MSSAAVMATAAKRRAAADAKRTRQTDTVSVTPDRRTDTAADGTADANSDTVSTPTRTPKRTSPRTSGRTDTGHAVAALRAKHPEMTAAEIAKRLKVTDRTVRRHLSTSGEADPGTPNLATA